MKRGWITCLLVVVAVCLSVQGADSVQEAASPSLQEENARLVKENEALRKENQRLRQLLVQQDANGRTGTEAVGTSSNGTKPAATCDFWLSTKSLRRHNSGCRMFQKSKGRPCGKDEGKPCGICGG